MRLVDRAPTLSAEIDLQFLPVLVDLGELLRGAGRDAHVGLWEEQVDGVGSAADFAAGEAVACCLWMECLLSTIYL